MKKFERDQIRELKTWKESRFLGIIEASMDDCLKTGDTKTMKVLYGLYVAQQRWLWMYEQETRRSIEAIVCATEEARLKQKASGKCMSKYSQPEWIETMQLGVISAIAKINEDMKCCSCKREKKVVAWVNLMFEGAFKKTNKKTKEKVRP